MPRFHIQLLNGCLISIDDDRLVIPIHESQYGEIATQNYAKKLRELLDIGIFREQSGFSQQEAVQRVGEIARELVPILRQLRELRGDYDAPVILIPKRLAEALQQIPISVADFIARYEAE